MGRRYGTIFLFKFPVADRKRTVRYRGQNFNAQNDRAYHHDLKSTNRPR